MSQDEESSGRVTRGALRRRSIDQDTSIGPGTPKKAASAKKGPALDAILETNGTAAEPLPRGVIKAVQKIKELEPEKAASGGRRSRAASLTEENVEAAQLGGSGEVRRTPRRRASQDVSVTPQTAPATTRRMTRRNSVTSEDGSVTAVSTPKATKSRLNVSVAPPTIVEDDEKDTSSASATAVPEADLSDLDIRKLRNRSISNSPVPRGSPTGKNSSIKEEDSNTSVASTKGVSILLQDIVKSPKPPTPVASPTKKVEEAPGVELTAETSVVEMEPLVVAGSTTKLNESVEMTPSKAANQSSRKSVSGSAQKLQKSVTFDELATPERQNQSAYPRTPVPASAEKSFKFGEKEVAEQQQQQEVVKSAEKKVGKSSPEVFDIDETVHESPKEAPQKEQADEPTKTPETPQKTADQSVVEIAEKSSADIDRSLANIVEDVRENMATAAAAAGDISILGTPAKPAKGGLLSRLREGSCSTPIAEKNPVVVGSPKFVSNTPDGRGEKKDDGGKLSKSWGQAVKGSAGKGIDVFSVRKQEEQERKDEETKRLNESLKELAKKRKSPKKTPRKEEDEEDDDEEVGVGELLGGESSQDESNFIDDEAMEVDADYESGDSMDSEERQEMEDNEVQEHGETIGSEDSDNEGSEEDDVGDDDSFIAPEDEDESLLEGSGDDLGGSDDEQQDKSKTKKRKRIIQVVDTSDDEKEVSKRDLSTVSLDRTATASENSAVEVVKSPKKTPVKATEQSPKKTPAKAAEQSPKKTPAKAAEQSPKKTPAKAPEQSPKKTPAKSPLPVKESPAKSPAPVIKESPAKESEKAPAVDSTEVPKSRKSLPPPVLISADFYSPATKKAKRATINVLANGEEKQPVVVEEEPAEKPSEKRQSGAGLLANPAALALAKKNKRQSLDQGTSADKKSENKRASLPGKLPADKQLDKSLTLAAKKGGKKQDIPEEPEDEPEPMEVDEVDEQDDAEQSDDGGEEEVEQVVPQTKKKPQRVVKDLSEFDTDAILNRCNEIVRADKERKKQSATLRQKKKDEKRRQRELEQAEGSGDGDDDKDKEAGDDSGSPDKKKKKKKKKPINYMLEELGETKEEQVARALKRKLALLEAKRERKKAKKAAKLQRQLNKENQDGENQAEGIGAKFEKKAKKKDKKSVVEQLVTEPAVEVPKVKLAVSAFQAYKDQIEALEKEKQSKGKKKTKELKEKNQQQQQQPPSAVDEVKAALKVESGKTKKDKKKVPEVAAEEVAPPEGDNPKKKKKLEQPEKVPKKSNEEAQAAALAEQKKLDEELAKIKKSISEPLPKVVKKPKSQAEQRKLDEDLAKLKQALSDPSAKVVKKQKLSDQEKPTVTCPEVESTPPRKLKALARLESGFTEEPVTPDQQKIKRNHGFREEPVTPKPVGFKVTAVLPTGQQELAQRAALTKKHNKKAANMGRVRLEDVQEPERGLPIPVWTRSGTFEVEELATAADKKKAKKSKSFDDGYIPVNGSGSAKSSTEFLVKPLGAKKDASAKKANRIDLATVDDEVINFKKRAIFGKTAHLRDKKSKH